MLFKGHLITVNDIKTSRNFYENILNQKVKYDFDEYVVYEGFYIQQKSAFAKMITIDEDRIYEKSNNHELYFEEDEIESFLLKLKGNDTIKYVHKLIEHPWGQRVIRFYDPDMHIIEVGESMESVAKRFLQQGLSVEETSKRIQLPVEFVKKCL